MSVLLFIAGVHMMVLLLAATYRYVDLWYRIGEFRAAITTRLLVLLMVDVVVTTLLPGDLAIAFIQGQGCYLMFHVAIFWLIRLGIRIALRR